MVGDLLQAERAEVSYEELGVRLFKPAPEGFDPIEASAEELTRYGYPERPDSEGHPDLYRQWKLMVMRTTSMVVPVFRELPEAVRPTVISPGYPPHPQADTSTSWSGGIVYAGPGDAVGSVAGMWTVPHVLKPGGESGNHIYISANWVGIDGWNPPDTRPTTPLQAGTTQVITQLQVAGLAFTLVDYFVWWEWVPDPPYTITNLPVSPGDVMHCEISAWTGTEATFNLANLTTGVSTSFMKSAPSGTKLVGNTAEWIVEKPIGSWYNNPFELARYGSVFFDDCRASTHDNQHPDGGTGELVTMTDDFMVPFSVPSSLGARTIRVDYTGGRVFI